MIIKYDNVFRKNNQEAVHKILNAGIIQCGPKMFT